MTHPWAALSTDVSVAGLNELTWTLLNRVQAQDHRQDPTGNPHFCQRSASGGSLTARRFRANLPTRSAAGRTPAGWFEKKNAHTSADRERRANTSIPLAAMIWRSLVQAIQAFEGYRDRHKQTGRRRRRRGIVNEEWGCSE